MRDRKTIEDEEISTRTPIVGNSWNEDDTWEEIESPTKETLILEVLLDIRDLLVAQKKNL